MQSSVKKRFFSKIVNNLIALVSNVIIGFVLPRNLGPSLYGNYSLAYDSIAQTLAFLELRSFTFFYNKLSANYRSRYLSSYTIITLVLIAIVTLMVGAIYFSGLNMFLLKDVPLYVALIALVIVIQKWLIDFFTRIYDALGLTLKSEKYKTIYSIIFILFTAFCLLINKFSLKIFFALNLLVFVPLLIFLIIKFKKLCNTDLLRLYTYKFTFGPIWKNLRRYCTPFLVTLVLQFIMVVLDRNLLQLKRGSHEQGMYGFSLYVTNVILILIAAITPIFQREIAIFNHKKDTAALRIFYDRIVPSFFLVVCYFAAFIIINVDDVIKLIGGDKFNGSRYILMISMGSTLAACYTNFNSSILYVLGKFGYTSRLLVYIFPVSVIYSFVFIYYFDFGSMALVCKNLISEFILFFLVQLFLSKEIGIKVGKHLLFLSYIFFLFAVVALFYNFLSTFLSFDSVFFKLLFKGCFYTLSLLALYIFLPSGLMIADNFGKRINVDRIVHFSKFKKV